MKSAKDFKEAADDAWRMEHVDEDEEAERVSINDPSRSALERGMAQVDVLDMLLLRRFFNACAKFDLLFSINIYSDASPASGEELQGMVIDVMCVDGSHERIVLPSSSLRYGMFDSVSKSMALLHAFWLIAGPGHDTLSYTLSKVMSVTTDFGTEIHTLELQDVSKAYCHWMAGTPMDRLHGYVDSKTRWLPFAIRMSGWSHTYGNMMKHVAESNPRWPFILKKLQAMVSFWRMTSWRKFVKRALKLNPPPDFDLNELDSFNASFAHWRYETVVEVLGELRRLRALCEGHMRPEWFANAQDRAMITDAFDAFGDKPLWTFIDKAYAEVFLPTERDRYWGMVCVCHEQDRKDGKRHIDCYWNSRKLSLASDYVKGKTAERLARARTIKEQDCEGNAAVHQQIKNMLQKTASCTKKRLGYLHVPPWTAIKCRTVAGATAFLEQVRAVEMEKHDPYTRWFMWRLGAHVVTRSGGGDLHVDLENEIDRMETSPLNEGAGEGVHRDVTYELKRASGSSQDHLKRMVRRKGVFRRLKCWRRTHGQRGLQVLRYEWKNWKRVVQTNVKRKWLPSKLTRAGVFARVYREDAKSEVNWSAVAAREANVHRATSAEVSPEEAAWQEFLRGQVRDGRRYSCEVPEASATQGPAAAPEPDARPHVFFFSSVGHGLWQPPRTHHAHDRVAQGFVPYSVHGCRGAMGEAGRGACGRGVRWGYGRTCW